MPAQSKLKRKTPACMSRGFFISPRRNALNPSRGQRDISARRASAGLGLRNKISRPKKNPRSIETGVFAIGAWQFPTFAQVICTIIGAKRFHFRGRDGIGWFPLALATRQTGWKEQCGCFKFHGALLHLENVHGVCVKMCQHPHRLGVIWSSRTGN